MSESEEILSPLSPGAKELFLEKGGMKKKPTRQICSCGHAVDRHAVLADGSGTTCGIPKTPCGCIEIYPVIEVDNLRFFMYATTGMCYGLDHALSKGLLMSDSNDYGYRWLSGEDPVCDKCREVTPFPIPIAIDRITGKIASDGSLGNNFNRIMCQGCFIEWTTPEVEPVVSVETDK